MTTKADEVENDDYIGDWYEGCTGVEDMTFLPQILVLTTQRTVSPVPLLCLHVLIEYN